MSFNLGPWQWDIDQIVVLVAAAALLLSLAVSLWAIARRLFARSPARFFMVLLLNLIAYSSVALLLAPPLVRSTTEQGVVLLTEGAGIDGVKANADLFVAPGADIAKDTNASWLFDIGQLRMQRPAMGSLRVLGHGLSPEQWIEIPGRVQVQFEATPLNGLVGIRWPGHLTMGEKLVVSGRYENAENRAARLELIDPGGLAVDEITLRPGQNFLLSAAPRVAGTHEYSLRISHEEQLSIEETIAVSVTPGRGARLLVIQSAPSFETRQLKNWATESGTPMLMLTRISRDRHISQAINLPDGADTRLSPALLTSQDLVIMDGRSWVEFSASQREWLSAAVQDGLGLLVLADTALADALPIAGDDLLSVYSMQRFEQEDQMTLPSWTGSDAQTPLPFLPIRLDARNGKTLVKGESGQALSVVAPFGSGHVALNIMREHYRWLGIGERSVYTAYWAMLIRETGRQRNAPYLLPQPSNSLNTVARKVSICALGNGQAMSAGIQRPVNSQSESDPLDFAEDLLGSNRHCTVFWPSEAGWHQLFLKDKESGEVLDRQSFYVFEAGEWQSHRQQLKQQASLQRAERNPLQPDQLESVVTRTSLGPIWPFLVFVISAGLLWLERKRDFSG